MSRIKAAVVLWMAAALAQEAAAENDTSCPVMLPPGKSLVHKLTWPQDNGYKCDMAMMECAGRCTPVVDLNNPSPELCETWMCLATCAKHFYFNRINDYDCGLPWRIVCRELARLEPPFGAGCGCDVDCSPAARIGPSVFLTFFFATAWRLWQ
eukprot:TRINITY_DN120945_c0_g1_i1.p1 TRINITY_DN120945_c0_g1~~TRINITY_DN120945_c0_g1_i1.p1  ORF type:complete len:153 (+),score=19.83 TRINITY_DN120945_c0_g1_i1:70-528(+)